MYLTQTLVVKRTTHLGWMV